VGLVSLNRDGIHRVQYEADEKEVRRALGRMDSDLRLVWEVDERTQSRVYKVYKFVSESQPVVWICDWRGDSGEPLPLTSDLVDFVASYRAGSRRPQDDPLAHNDALEAEIEREWQEALEDQIKQGERRLRTSPSIKPSHALAMSRARGRRKGLSK